MQTVWLDTANEDEGQTKVTNLRILNTYFGGKPQQNTQVLKKTQPNILYLQSTVRSSELLYLYLHF